VFGLGIKPLVFRALFVLVFLVVPREPSLNLFKTRIHTIDQDFPQNAAIAIPLLVFNRDLFTGHDGS
jgi:hypothetical protein